MPNISITGGDGAADLFQAVGLSCIISLTLEVDAAAELAPGQVLSFQGLNNWTPGNEAWELSAENPSHTITSTDCCWSISSGEELVWINSGGDAIITVTANGIIDDCDPPGAAPFRPCSPGYYYSRLTDLDLDVFDN